MNPRAGAIPTSPTDVSRPRSLVRVRRGSTSGRVLSSLWRAIRETGWTSPHMHLCANALLAGLLPLGTLVRRNFSFQPGEKGAVNRLHRQAVDKRLARRHRLTDFFFSLPPLEPQSRLERILSLAHQFCRRGGDTSC